MMEPQGRAIAQGAEINRLLAECERMQTIIDRMVQASQARNREIRDLKRELANLKRKTT